MANTPNLDLVKPAGTDHALVSVINSNSDKIDAGVGTLSEQIANTINDFGSKTISGMNTAIEGKLSSMSVGESISFKVTLTDTDSVIATSGAHTGIATKSADSRINATLIRSGTSTIGYYCGTKTSNGWVWQQIAPIGAVFPVAGWTSGDLNNADPFAAVTYTYGSVSSIINRPNDKGSVIYTFLNDANNAFQIGHDRTSGSVSDISVRNKVDNTWNGWEQLATRKDFAKTKIQSVSAYSSRSEGLAGGYIKVGNIVYVSIIGKVTTNISNNDLIISGLPKPNSTNLPLAGQNDSTKTILRAVVNQNGGIAVGAMSANEYFTIAGSYVSLE